MESGVQPMALERNRKAPGAAADTIVRLPAPQPFSFEQNYKYMTRSADEILFHAREGRILKALPFGSGTLVVEIAAATGDDGAIALRFAGGAQPGEAARTEAIRYVRDWFDLDTDLAPFYEMGANDPLLGGTLVSFRGLRNVGIPDLFEALSWGIIGQQINLAYAYTLKRRLVERFGRHTDCEGERHWIFPAARDVAGLSVDDFAGLGMTVKKSEYLIGVARLIADGALSKESLLAAGPREAERTLVNIRGIGPWTAHYVLMRCLRAASAFPVDDIGLHNALKHVLGLERKPPKADIVRMFAPWAGWEAYAVFYLWRILY